jgi:hypothetical protein
MREVLCADKNCHRWAAEMDIAVSSSHWVVVGVCDDVEERRREVKE